MHKRTKRLIAYGEQCGFVLEGKDGHGHFQMRHPNGETVQVAGSPGDYRGDRNMEAEMRRKSGVTPSRPSAGQYRHIRRRGFSMRHALAEKDDRLSGEFHTASDSFTVMVAERENLHLRKLRLRHAELAKQIESTPYPYLIQEHRRLTREIEATEGLL